MKQDEFLYRRADAASLRRPFIMIKAPPAIAIIRHSARLAEKKTNSTCCWPTLGSSAGNPPARRLEFAPADPSRELGPLLDEVEARPSDLCGRPEPRKSLGTAPK